MVSQRIGREAGGKRKFLAIIDGTPECTRAASYAAYRAKASGGGAVLLFVIEPADFQHWLGVEKLMRAEAQEEAENALAKVAEDLREVVGIEPEGVIREGKIIEEIHAQVEAEVNLWTVAQLADRLEELGLIEREPHPTDRRVKNLVLTAKGKRFKKSIPGKLWDGPNTFSALSDGERADLTALLSKLVDSTVDEDSVNGDSVNGDSAGDSDNGDSPASGTP